MAPEEKTSPAISNSDDISPFHSLTLKYKALSKSIDSTYLEMEAIEFKEEETNWPISMTENRLESSKPLSVVFPQTAFFNSVR